MYIRSTSCGATARSNAPSLSRAKFFAAFMTCHVHGCTVIPRGNASRFIRETSLSGSWKLIRRCTCPTASNAASIPRTSFASSRACAVISTNVPSSGRHRRISMLERDFIECEQAFHAISDVPATQRCSADVFNVAIEFERRSAVLTDKLGEPLLISNLATVGLAIIHGFEWPAGAVRVQSHRISDNLVLADNFIDDKPATAADAPNLLVVTQNTHAARLLNGLALNARQLHRRRRE